MLDKSWQSGKVPGVKEKKTACEKDVERLLHDHIVTAQRRMRSNGKKVVRHQKRFPREVVDASSLELLKIRLDGALSNLA